MRNEFLATLFFTAFAVMFECFDPFARHHFWPLCVIAYVIAAGYRYWFPSAFYPWNFIRLRDKYNSGG